jgi:hypothetical protein
MALLVLSEMFHTSSRALHAPSVLIVVAHANGLGHGRSSSPSNLRPSHSKSHIHGCVGMKSAQFSRGEHQLVVSSVILAKEQAQEMLYLGLSKDQV